MTTLYNTLSHVVNMELESIDQLGKWIDDSHKVYLSWNKRTGWGNKKLTRCDILMRWLFGCHHDTHLSKISEGLKWDYEHKLILGKHDMVAYTIQMQWAKKYPNFIWKCKGIDFSYAASHPPPPKEFPSPIVVISRQNTTTPSSSYTHNRTVEELPSPQEVVEKETGTIELDLVFQNLKFCYSQEQINKLIKRVRDDIAKAYKENASLKHRYRKSKQQGSQTKKFAGWFRVDPEVHEAHLQLTLPLQKKEFQTTIETEATSTQKATSCIGKGTFKKNNLSFSYKFRLNKEGNIKFFNFKPTILIIHKTLETEFEAHREHMEATHSLIKHVFEKHPKIHLVELPRKNYDPYNVKNAQQQTMTKWEMEREWCPSNLYMATMHQKIPKDILYRDCIPFSKQHVIHVIKQIAEEALVPLHEMGILHRDITPTNIFVNTTMNADLHDYDSINYMGKLEENKYSYAYWDSCAIDKQIFTPFTDLYALATTFSQAYINLSFIDLFDMRKTDFLSQFEHRILKTNPHNKKLPKIYKLLTEIYLDNLTLNTKVFVENNPLATAFLNAQSPVEKVAAWKKISDAYQIITAEKFAKLCSEINESD